jgi:precorrin-2/cobalt-factor-2 C20-methyltransferase
MAGCLYGVGVGPGDPELMTLKAVRCIRRCPVIAIPTGDKQTCTAYQIVRQEIPEIEEKECLSIVMPMTKNKEILEKSHTEGAEAVAAVLVSGQDVAFLTIGDPTVYATYMYIHQRIVKMGYEAVIISGVPSFCAAAGKLGISLAETKEQLHIIPASYDIEAAMELPGTKVLMKAGKKMPQVREMLAQHPQKAMMVENCGMADEHIWTDTDRMPEHPGYYTLVIVREDKEAKA